MPMSLNRAAQQRAALNRAGMIGPLACSALVIAIVAARAAGALPLLGPDGARALGASLRALLWCELPMAWVLLETTPWRRYAAMRRGRLVLCWQALALLLAIATMSIART